MTHLILPLFGAAIAAASVSIDFWDASKASILTALSVIGAGVLVRLARGLPFTNADQFQVDEARRIATAVKQSVRSLRLLIIVILTTMSMLVLAKGVFAAAMFRWPDLPWVEPAVSSTIGFFVTYILVRISAVIKGDVGLVDLQSEFFIKAVERKQAERFEKLQVDPSRRKISNPADYGKILSNGVQ